MRSAPPATEPAPRAVQKQEANPAPPENTPQPTVTSTMNTATQSEAKAAIDAVNERLAKAGSPTAASKEGAQISLIRKLRDSAQRALDEQDYLTAQSLAQKAFVLAAQLPGNSGQQPPPSH